MPSPYLRRCRNSLGAAVGCLVLDIVIGMTDGITTAFAIAWLAVIASACFLAREKQPKALILSCLSCLGLGVFVVVSAYQVSNRIGRQLVLTNDAGGGTFLTAFDGDLSQLRFLKHDIASIAHYLRPDSHVLVVGAGGGRDVLAALVFDQPAVTAVEINRSVVEAANGPFGDFTGHLDRQPGVTFVAADARSFAARQDDRYDILQFSFVDTYAGTAAGAFALTENSLYTTAAWGVFLQSLSPAITSLIFLLNSIVSTAWPLLSCDNKAL